MKNYDYWKKSQITDISTFCYWLHQKGVGIYDIAESGIKHQKSNKIKFFRLDIFLTWTYKLVENYFQNLPKTSFIAKDRVLLMIFINKGTQFAQLISGKIPVKS